MESSPALDPALGERVGDSVTRSHGRSIPPQTESSQLLPPTVADLRRRTTAYVTVVSGSALGLALLLVPQLSSLDATRQALAVTMFGFMIVAWLFPLPFASQTKLYLDTSVIFASILLFEPGLAMLIAATGTGVAHAMRRRTLGESIFNTSQTAIQAAIGGMVLALGGWSTDAFRFDREIEVVAVLMAGLVIYMVNTCLVAGVISLQTSHDLFRVWRESTADTSWTEILSHLSQLGIGLIAAIAASSQAWSVILLLGPSITIYTSFSRHLELRKIDAEKLRGAEEHLVLAQEEAVRQGESDQLTGLPNRRHMLDHLDLVMTRRSETMARISLLVVDIDRFKVVNDSLGTAIGDRLLVECARRIRACVPEGADVARLGADEFSVMLSVEATSLPSHPGSIAQDILDAFVTPMTVGDQDVFLTASIGISELRSNHRTPADLLREADVALFLAKQRGKSRYEVFDASVSDFTPERVGLETDLRRALERGEISLMYQPIVALRSGRIEGFEALARWNHPLRGVVSPGKFIPLAEETGLIVPIGRWVMVEACRQARQWHDKYRLSTPSISVNLSAKQFHRADLISDVAHALNVSGLEPQALRLEITESVIMEDAESAIETLRQLKALGVELAIDDFGTGYSSLAYLRRFPVDLLKIDRSFISGLGRSNEDTTITQAVVSLGHALSMIVVAEGIETIGQLVHLCSLNCELGQGNHFSEPVAPREAESLLTSETLSLQPVLSLPLHLAPTVA